MTTKQNSSKNSVLKKYLNIRKGESKDVIQMCTRYSAKNRGDIFYLQSDNASPVNMYV